MIMTWSQNGQKWNAKLHNFFFPKIIFNINGSGILGMHSKF